MESINHQFIKGSKNTRMLDIKLIREKTEQVRKGLKNRGGGSLKDLEHVLERDKKWLEIIRKLEDLRAERNKAADQIGKLKKEGKDASSLIKEMEDFKHQYKATEEIERTLKTKTNEFLLYIPNIPDESVPLGKSEDDNVQVRVHGEKPQFSFKPKDHHEIGTDLGIFDFEKASQLSGSAFALYKGKGARLERAVSNFMLDLHTQEHGYKEMSAPFMVSTQTITNSGQLPKFTDDLYKCKDDDLWLIPTSEVTLANLFRDQVLSPEDLPQGVTALTPCFRREAGSYGKDVRGLIRNHQFSKVELVRACEMKDSLAELEKLTGHAEEVLKRLGLPYQVMALCTHDIGFASAKTFDLEVWMPGYNKYREISSCSTCTDFQSRRLNFKVKKDKKREFGCTLNGSGLAVGRTVAAILENFQQEDGSVLIPKVLQPYFGDEVIKP